MSHGPESHHNHEPAPEPERIPIADPGKAGVDYKVVNPFDFTTTHRDPDGNFYTIKNTSSTEANWRLGKEKERNARLAEERKAQLAFAAENGLYRTNSAGQVIRPAASSEDFTAQVTNAGMETTPGNYDIGNPGGYISYGQSENGSNELVAIAERSASIVESYTARDAALAEGKTLEEAQTVGSEVYLEQERLRHENSHGQVSQPEASSVEFVEKPEEPSPEDEEETAERDKKRLNPKLFFKKIGHSIVYGTRLAKGGALPLETHSQYHKDEDRKEAITAAINDKVDKALTTFEEADERFSEKARYTIENLPFLTGLALEHTAKELLMQIDLKLDHMTTLAESGIEKGKQFAIDQYKKAIAELGAQREKAVKAILDLYDRVVGKRKRTWARTRPIYDERVSRRIKELKQYLATKHPDNPRYTA